MDTMENRRDAAQITPAYSVQTSCTDIVYRHPPATVNALLYDHLQPSNMTLLIRFPLTTRHDQPSLIFDL